MESLKL